MMATDAFTVELVSPEEKVLATPATMVVVPGVAGDFGAMPQHAPLVSAMRPGLLTVHTEDGNRKEYVVTGGFAEVTGDKITVLADEVFLRAKFDQEFHAGRLVAAEKAAEPKQIHAWQELARILP